METFLKDEQCSQCGGPLLSETCTRTEFVEQTFDYVQVTVWLCYSCGHENQLDSQPFYVV